jgi:hypothetical protein
MSKDNFFCKIKVTNLDTKAVYIHGKVPYEHVEMLKLNPNLEVDILGHYRDGGDEYRKTLQKDRNSIII